MRAEFVLFSFPNCMRGADNKKKISCLYFCFHSFEGLYVGYAICVMLYVAWKMFFKINLCLIHDHACSLPILLENSNLTAFKVSRMEGVKFMSIKK